MSKFNLKQHYRGEDGKLYRAGRGVEVPKAANLKLGGDSAGAKAPKRTKPVSTEGQPASTDSTSGQSS